MKRRNPLRTGRRREESTFRQDDWTIRPNMGSFLRVPTGRIRPEEALIAILEGLRDHATFTGRLCNIHPRKTRNSAFRAVTMG